MRFGQMLILTDIIRRGLQELHLTAEGGEQRVNSAVGVQERSWDLAAAAATASTAAAWSFEAVLGHALRGQLRQNIVQVVWVGVAVARQVGHHLCFMVDAVPHHCVGLAGGAGGSHGEDKAAHPCHLQQLQHLPALVVVW